MKMLQRVMTFGVVLLIASMFAVSNASAVSRPSPFTIVGGSGWTWADCVYDQPLPAASQVIATIAGVKLTCGGVRHIKSGHGFDNYTEACISNALTHRFSKETSKSNSSNWLYTALWAAGGGEYLEYLQAYVVVSKSNPTVVTAYVETNITTSDAWYTCAKIKF